MEFEKEIKKKIIRSDFAKNNGRIIRTINILSGKFINLDSVNNVLKEYMNLGDFKVCIDYLYKSFYIEVRNAVNKSAVSDFDKYVFRELEATLTQKGIKLAMGYIEDEAVEI